MRSFSLLLNKGVPPKLLGRYFNFIRGCPFCLLKNHRNNDMLTGTKDS